jgi:hypothetical protein
MNKNHQQKIISSDKVCSNLAIRLPMVAVTLILSALSSMAETARRSDDLVESIGFATHWNYQDYIYNTQYTKVRDHLYNSGVRYMRHHPMDTGVFQDRLKEMYNNRGIKVLFLADRRVSYDNNHADKSQIQSELNIIKAYPKEMVIGVEGLNEYDENAPQSERNDGSWETYYKEYQQELYNKVSADSWFDGIPVGCGTMLDAWRDHNYFPDGERASTCDIGMAHHYPTDGEQPALTASLGKAFPRREALSFIANSVNNKPCWITEAGYATTFAGQTLSNKAIAKLIPRLVCQYFKTGYQKTFIHELADDGPFSFFNPSDASPRPSYYALKNLVTLLKDASWNTSTKRWTYPTFKLGALDYSLSGDTRNVESMLFQKSNGKYYLLLWQELDVYENSSDINNADKNIKVQLNAQVSSVKRYSLYNESNPGAALSGTELGTSNLVTVSVPDHILVLEITNTTAGWWTQGHFIDDRTIGNPSKASNGYHTHDRYFVSGGGGDIWGSNDSFHLMSRLCHGDEEITARIDSQQNTNGWAKAGVMMREHNANDPGALYAAVLVTPSNGIIMQNRSTRGGNSESQNVAGVSAPCWVRLKRVGQTYSGYYSTNGTSWTKFTNDKMIKFNDYNWAYSPIFDQRAHVGLASTATDNTQLSAVVFSRVEFGGAIRRLTNRWKGHNLTNVFHDDLPTYTPLRRADEDLWMVLNTNEAAWKNIKSLTSGRRLSIIDWYDYVRCDYRITGDDSRWGYQSLAGTRFYNLKNKWTSASNMLHIENLRGYAQHLNGNAGWWSAQWTTAPIDSVITLRGANDKYVSHNNATTNAATDATCNTVTANDKELFYVVASDDKVAIKGKTNNLYLSSENGAASMRCNRSAIGSYEQFDWIENGDGTISLKGNNGKYVSNASPLKCDSTTAVKFKWSFAEQPFIVTQAQ